VAEGTPADVVALHQDRSAKRRAKAKEAGVFGKAVKQPGAPGRGRGRRRRER
jgi:hypothetical protein